jgi:hypothetical protein
LQACSIQFVTALRGDDGFLWHILGIQRVAAAITPAERLRIETLSALRLGNEGPRTADYAYVASTCDALI